MYQGHPQFSRNERPPQASRQGFRARPPQNEIRRPIASALRLKNFKQLVDAVGEEHLAVWLAVSLPRLRDMANGIEFSDETAYHVETTLGLVSGFIDRVNPSLSEDERARLKQYPADERIEEVISPPSATRIEPEFLKPSEEISMAKSNQTQQLAVPGEPELSADDQQRLLRRSNLSLLTSRTGAKTQLAILTGMSAANISHRLHGNKIFDLETGKYFSEVLGLSAAWFETSQNEDSIPLETLKLLTTKNSGATASTTKLITPPAGAKRGRKVSLPTNLAAVKADKVSLSPVLRGKPDAPAFVAPAQVRPALSVNRPAPVAEIRPAPVAAVARAPSLATQALAEAGPVGPITEALLRTLAAKARDGRLSEEKALTMLVEAAAF